MKTIEEKAQAYDEALERANAAHKDEDRHLKATLERIFPELKESDDERIRKGIIRNLKYLMDKSQGFVKDELSERIAWLENQANQKSILNVPSREIILSIWDLGNEWKELTGGCISTEYGTQLDYIQKHWNESEYYLKEKQGEQKPADKVEPKFHEGDWAVSNLDKNARQISEVYVDEYDSYYSYYVVNGKSVNLEEYDRLHHLWNITDAKPGDVLATDNAVFIFKSIDKTGLSICKSYCEVIDNSELGFGFDFSINNIHPATKEQHELLFTRIKEAGCKWDAEKKELKAIKPNFKIGEWVVFNNNHESIYQIEKIENFQYTLRHILGGSMPLSFSSEDMIRHWTIKDIKDGDVLSNGTMIVIFKHFEEPSYRQHIVAYVGLDNYGDIQITNDTWELGIDKAKPANKEQRELLFSKMRESDYEWNNEKKELKEIKSKFNVGDWIFSSVLGTAHIININEYDEYLLEYTDGYQDFVSIDYVNYEFDKWSIKDAMPGDVLAFNDGTSGVLLYKENTENFGVLSYCRIVRNNFIDKEESGWGSTLLSPATKEQRELLFEKMHESGYELLKSI